MFRSEGISNPVYKNRELKETWGDKTYDKYLSINTWKWTNFPNFSERDSVRNKCVVPNGESVLEVGCAGGKAYEFLKSQNAVSDLTDYTGIDVSEKGIKNCVKNFPEANWINADLTSYKFDRKYDFTFERIAVHHMPNPLKIIDNLASITNKSLATGFVSCYEGSTISDLRLARYRHANGEFVYFDIINPFEVCEVLLDHGFRKFEFVFDGVHEKIDSNPLGHQYLSPDILRDKRMISRTTIIATKTSTDSIQTKLYGTHSNKINLINSSLRNIKSILTGRWLYLYRLKKYISDFEIRPYGVVPKSKYYV
tara:strand:- start:101 stop:1030 length:930 start_codon:yes stop_codon:yes gene_type:complete